MSRSNLSNKELVNEFSKSVSALTSYSYCEFQKIKQNNEELKKELLRRLGETK